MKRKGRLILLHVIAALFTLAPVFVHAATLPSRIVTCTGKNCTCQSLVDTAANILSAGIFLAVFLTGILFMYAGFQLLMNQSNSGGLQKAKSLLWHVGIGFIGILAAWLIIDTLLGGLTSGSTFKVVWNALCG